MISRSQTTPRRVAVMSLWLIAVASIAVLAAPGRAEAAATVAWRVENPFRFFVDPRDTEVHRQIYRSLGPDQRSTPVLSAERALQSGDPDGWASSMYRKTCWSNNRFKCDAYKDYINPTSHAVIFTVEGVDDAKMLSCTWLTAPRDSDTPRGDAVTQPCSEPARFVIPYPKGAVVSVEIGGLEVAKADVKVRDILIAGMGDSFASGEGNPDLAVRFSRERSADYSTVGIYSGLTGYPARVGPWRELGDKEFIKGNARWLDQACHRSLYSEQLRTALQLAVEDPHRAVTFVGVSCAGAEVTDGLFLRYKGNEWVPNPPRYSQISALAEAQCGANATAQADVPEAYHINGQVPELKDLILRKCPQDSARKIDLVLVSIGGNDIGFSRLLANAVLSNESILRELGGWLGEVHGEAEASAQLRHLGARYKALNRALHNILYMPWNESDRILLVAYPGLALAGDGSETCGSGNAGMEAVPDFQLDGTKLRLGTWFADKLNRQMRESAYEYGWTFVETHRRAFIGRGICAGLSVAGVSQVDDLRLPRKVDGVWTPYNPADYLPYASRQRWFRTPNDAFMTANFHVAAGLLTKVLKIEPFAPFQLLLASTYSGAFHPTAEGQAAIADAVADKARAVLAKYGEGSDRDAAYLSSIKSDDAPPAPVDEPGRDIPDVKSVLTAPPTGVPAPAVEPEGETGGVKAVVSGPNDVQVGTMPQPQQGAAPLDSKATAPVTGAAPLAPLPMPIPAAGADANANANAAGTTPPASPPADIAVPQAGAAPDTGLGEAKAILAPTNESAPVPVVGTGAPASSDMKAPVSDAAAAPPAPVSSDQTPSGALPETAVRPFAPASGN
jgi:lysophospholipase L1-like esterase